MRGKEKEGGTRTTLVFGLPGWMVARTRVTCCPVWGKIILIDIEVYNFITMCCLPVLNHNVTEDIYGLDWRSWTAAEGFLRLTLLVTCLALRGMNGMILAVLQE